MKITEQEYGRFFDGVQLRNVALPSTGEVFQMPLIGEKAIQMAAFFTASKSRVLEMLPIPDLVPVRLDGDRTVLGVIGIEYIKRNISVACEKYLQLVAEYRAGKWQKR